jgi:hypothetical protein
VDHVLLKQHPDGWFCYCAGQMVSDQCWPVPSVTAERDRQRRRDRAERIPPPACWRSTLDHLAAVHADNRMPATIAVRRYLILRPGETDQYAVSPARQLVRPRGDGLAFYLSVLFDAQCRRPSGAVVRNQQQLKATGSSAGWVALLPASTASDAARLRQLQRTLVALAEARLVEIDIPGVRNRFVRFVILDEGSSVYRRAYRVPGRYDAVTRVPSRFFLNGWAHVLLPAETIMYLVLLDLQQQLGPTDVYLADTRKAQYCLTRDLYEHHGALAVYGLIEKLPDPDRRPDGRFWRRSRTKPHPLRFRVLDWGTDRQAYPAVAAALRAGW